VTTPFCDTVGAEMDDSMTFSVYLDQIDEDKEADGGKSNNDGDEEDQGNPQNQTTSKTKEKVSETPTGRHNVLSVGIL
jgi:hypothetical protein